MTRKHKQSTNTPTKARPYQAMSGWLDGPNPPSSLWGYCSNQAWSRMWIPISGQSSGCLWTNSLLIILTQNTFINRFVILIFSLLNSRRSLRISLKWIPSSRARSWGSCSSAASFRIFSSIKTGSDLSQNPSILLSVLIEARLVSLFPELKKESRSYYVNLEFDYSC